VHQVRAVAERGGGRGSQRQAGRDVVYWFKFFFWGLVFTAIIGSLR
jgi:hypothetical protein